MTITFVGSGTAAVASNTSVAPTVHASTAAGDVVLVHATIRNSGTGVPNTPTGWTLIADNGNEVIVGKRWAAGDVAPTITFTGGAANATTTAQSATWRGVGVDAIDQATVATQLNASAQNIAYPALDVPGSRHVVVLAGWKQDDATSVTTPGGYTLLDTVNTTTGDDALATWFYKIETTEADVAAASITVTGGTAQISRGISLALRATASITADEQDVWPPRVLISVTDLIVGDTVDVYRVAGGQRTLVRAGSATVTDTSFLRTDAELPFGVPVHYLAVVNGLAEYETAPDTYTLDGGKVALTDAITGLSAEAVILAWDERAYNRQASTFKVGGRNVVVTGDFGMFEGTIEVYVDSTSSRDNLTALLRDATEATIQIRQAGGYDGVDCYVAVTGATERRWSQDGSDQRRVWAIQAAEVDGWGEALEAAGYTLQDIGDAYDGQTLDDLEDDYATLLAIAQGEFG